MGPRAGVDGRKISSPPGFDPGPSSPWSVTTSTDLPGPPPPLVPMLNCMQLHLHSYADMARRFAKLKKNVNFTVERAMNFQKGRRSITIFLI